ncbi:ABC transporter ATP-binding protein [Pseudogemmobacter humi]|uniref:Spermidine/putrescine import ATP-binding protein PotA n=1 Tax=Pseudogemmobacter humi TaxID=2483812 RepID=A0A3P5WH50_9RHOB|nr:ABC transporter ATP-binding protein [Pseudogemmobacter humi]VDC22943.1 Spermidine/putrescine import ATP-binding protein PotA [Pseudogemmobacter humi]
MTGEHIPGPGGPDALVRFEQVKKSYDGLQYVVKDLNLDVARGEFLTMLGPSGSGKTTTLMMLGGFERPTLGRIMLDGKPVERLPPEKRNIGFVFQNYALFPHMTVAENVAFPLRYRGIRGQAAAAKMAQALGRVGLDAMGERRPAQLSGGQQQRVALARALVFEPSLVLMDEPLGALDKQLRERMQVEIKHLQTSLGITMVYVTHDQSEALTMSDRIAVFHDGRIQQLADPQTLYNAPANRFVAGFIGENNTMRCSPAGQEGGFTVVRMADGTAMRAPGSAGPGELSLSVRPENIMLAEETLPPGANLFSGIATDVFFLGDHMRLSVSAFGGETVTARIPVAAARSFHPGETVHLACKPADCRLLEG